MYLARDRGRDLFLIYPLIFTLPFPRHLMIMIFLYATLGLAWNMIGGYAGQISLGHALFFGIGAYTSTLMLMKLGVSPWVGMLVGGILSVGIALSSATPASSWRATTLPSPPSPSARSPRNGCSTGTGQVQPWD